MATLTSDLAASNSAFTGPGGGVVYVRECVYSALSSLALNDVIQMIPVAPGERVVDLQLICEDLDTGTPAIVLDVGDGDDTDRYIDGSTAAQAGGVTRMGSGIDTDAEAIAYNKLYTVADTIDVLVQVAAATPAAGTIRLRAFLVRG